MMKGTSLSLANEAALVLKILPSKNLMYRYGIRKGRTKRKSTLAKSKRSGSLNHVEGIP